MESGVPNPQSGRVARAEDEAKGEENSGFHSALMTTGDLVGSLSGLSVQGGEEIQQEISQPGKLFIGGVSGTTTQEGFDNYFSQVSMCRSQGYLDPFFMSISPYPNTSFRTVWIFDRFGRHV